MDCSQEATLDGRTSFLPVEQSDPGAGYRGGSPSLETLSWGEARHGAAMGGMYTHTFLYPLVPAVTLEDRFEGRLVGLGT